MILIEFLLVLQPQWMAPEVLRNESADEKYILVFCFVKFP